MDSVRDEKTCYLREFYTHRKQWKIKIYMADYQDWEVYRRLIGGYRFTTLTDKEQDTYAELITPILSEFDDDVYQDLFKVMNWRFRMVGYWFAGITMQRQYVDTIGEALVQYPNHATAQVFALVRFNHPRSIDYLKRHLDTHFFTEEWHLQRDNWFWAYDYLDSVSLNWALAGLSYLDDQNNTEHANKYLTPDNQLEKFYLSTLDKIEESRQFNTVFADSKGDFHTHYKHNWEIQKPKLAIESAVNFANKYFPKYQ